MIIDNVKYRGIPCFPFVGKCLWVCALLLFFSAVRAQYVSNGTDPASATWSHIRGDHFDVIFPDSIRAQSEHFMRLLNKVYAPASASMGYRPRRIPVILHPYNLQSNGMVVWAPSRMEILTTAPTDGYGQPWLEQLALHEYRHVVQTDMMNRGFTRGLYFLLGEQAVAFPSALIQPWLFEGDAVSNETAMSFTGRGRMPSFEMGLRTISLSGKKYSYSKYLLGSYKDYIPSHYEYGYQMTAYGKYRYGPDLWGKVFRYSGSYPFLIFTQSLATKKYTGKNSKKFHWEAKQFLDSMWRQMQPPPAGNSEVLVEEKRCACDNFIDYSSLIFARGNLLFAQQKTMSRTLKLVRVDSSKTATNETMLGSVSSKLTAFGDSVYWTEYRPDLRWEQKNFSELWCYDVEKGKAKRLTKKTSYFTPAVSRQQALAVSKKMASGEQAIVLLNADASEERELFRFPPGKSVNDLAWIDESRLAVLYTSASGMSIGVLDVRSDEMDTLLPFTYVEISDLSAHDGKVYFSSGYDGTGNIYAVDVQSKKVCKLTGSAYGATSARVDSDGKNLLYADYTVRGGKPVSTPVDSLLWEETTFDNPYKFPLAEAIARQERFVLDTAVLDTAPLEVKKYGKLAHLFRLHSWMPFAFSPSEFMNGNFSSAAIGATLLSQNNLSSAITALGYEYQNGFSSVNASFTYYGLFPVFSLSGSYGKRYQRVYDYVLQSTYSSSKYYGELHANMYVPLNLSRGNLVITLAPSVQYSLYSDEFRFSEDDGFRKEQAISLGVAHSLYTRMALRDINPRWGYRLSGSVLNAPFINIPNFNNGLAQQWNIQGNIYLPGMLCNHSIKLYGGYEHQRNPAIFASKLLLPRGGASEFDGYAFDDACSMSFSYAFPLWYPDLSLGLVAYIKRIRANLFYDSFLLVGGVNTHVNSAGYEAVFDTNVFRFSSFMLSLGWRQSFVNSSYQGSYTKAELLLSFSY